MSEDSRTAEEKLELIEESRLAELVDTEGWAIVKRRALEYVETLESVKTLPAGTNEEVGEEAKVRARVIGLFLTWLNDIESVKEAKLQDISSQQPDYIRFNE
jgi:hypothetical protein